MAFQICLESKAVNYVYKLRALNFNSKNLCISSFGIFILLFNISLFKKKWKAKFYVCFENLRSLCLITLSNTRNFILFDYEEQNQRPEIHLFPTFRCKKVFFLDTSIRLHEILLNSEFDLQNLVKKYVVDLYRPKRGILYSKAFKSAIYLHTL